MKRSVIFALVILFTGAIAATSSSLAAEPYLFEMLTRPAYQKAWNGLFAGEKDIDAWLTKYAKTKNGPTSPGAIVVVGNTQYQINTVCKPHDCEDNQFLVLFAPNGTRAWGLLLKSRTDERYFGSPVGEIKKVLRAAASSE